MYKIENDKVILYKQEDYMKKLILSTILLCTISKAMNTIQLPSAEILGKRLSENGLGHFMEKTKIDKDLGGRQLYPLGVANAVETALYDYDQYLKQPQIAVLMQTRKPQIIEIILQDHPEAIKDLEERGILS